MNTKLHILNIKTLLCLLLLAAFSVDSFAQTAAPTPNFQPKKKKKKKGGGNHSNGRTELGYSSIYSVMYDTEEGNTYGSTLMTPGAWGGSKSFLFAHFGGTPIQPYGTADNPDLFGQIGFGLGDATKFVSVVGIVNINDMSKFDNFSYSLVASHNFSNKSAVTVGALHLFADPAKTDAGPSYYAAYSHAINNKLTYTVGIGSGRFYDNSDLDVIAGKKAHGTAVFANVSYEVLRNVHVNAEWTGLNLCLSGDVRISSKLPVITLGVTDITRVSADKPSFYGGISKAFSFNKTKNTK